MLRYYALVVCLVAGCAVHEPPLPEVPRLPDDLSTWTVPDMVLEQRSVPPPPRREEAPRDAKPTPAEKVYRYQAGETYAAPVSVGFPLDILLDRGEHVHNVTDGDRAPQADGDTRRWEVRQGLEGQGPEERHHIFVTVTQPGLKNGLIVTTTRRTLYITLESVAKSPVRVLRWAEEPVAAVPAPVDPVALGPLPPLQHHYHVGYTMESQGRAPDWFPLGTWDDGKKMYVLLPITTVYGTTPLIRKLGPNGPAVVNGRQYLNVLIIDELAARLELRVGVGATAEIVQITRGALRTIPCPEHEGCPLFPPFQGGAS